MRVRRLDIFGFKSFADKTTFHFDDGITGIVGPNGCGKSNVVDALRWAMGEQSPRHLRGGSMQDVIFGGSAKRGPLGFAEVSITFANDGSGIVPLEYAHFPEIQITRRLHRDGTSEYEIGRTPCRLKDITDLFLGTGIGNRAYSIIEQGQVSSIINAKPEERRRIVEEAAGVTKYKVRRRDAEKKMELTRQNLLRAQDVADELNKRLQTLRRQAKRAEKARTLEQNIERLEMHQAVVDFFRFTVCRNYSNDRIRIEKRQCEKLTNSVVKYEQQLKELRHHLQGDEQKAADAQARVYDLGRAVALCTQEIEHNQSVLVKNRESIQQAQQQLDFLVTEREKLDAQKIGLLTLQEELEDQHSENDAAAQAQSELESLRHSRQQLDKNLDGQRQRQLTIVKELSRAGAELRQLEKAHGEGGIRLDAIERDLKNIENDLHSYEDTLLAMEDESDEREAEKRQLQQERQGHSQRLDALRRSIRSKNQEITDAERKKSEIQGRLQSIQQLVNRREHSPAGARHVLDSQRHNPYIRGLLIEQLDVDIVHEEMLLQALSDWLDAVFVDTDDHTDGLSTALRSLTSNQATHPTNKQTNQTIGATLLASDVLRSYAKRVQEASKPHRQHLHENNCRALHTLMRRQESAKIDAQDSQKYQKHDDTVPPLVMLASTVWLCPDENTALSLWPTLSQTGITLVTPQGTLFSPTGFVRTGDGGKGQQNQQLLAYRRELRTLDEDLEKQQQVIKNFQEQLVTLEDELQEIEDQLDGYDDDIRSLDQWLLEAKSEKSRRQEQIAQARDRQRKLDIERQKLNNDISRAKHELDTWRMQVHTLDGEQSRLATEQIALSQDLARLDQRIHEANEQLTARRIEHAASQERRLSIVKSLQQNDEQRRHNTQRSDHLQHTLQQAKDETGRIEQQWQAAQAQLSVFHTHLQQAQADLDSIKIRNVSLYESIEAVEKELTQARQKLATASQNLHIAEADAAQQEQSLAALNARIFTKYRTYPQQHLADYHMLSLPLPQDSKKIVDLQKQLKNLGAINPLAIDECKRVEEQHQFLQKQVTDLKTALEQLEQAISTIDGTTRKRFHESFLAIDERFQLVFPRLFRGGKAWLQLADAADLLNTGVDICAQPPGKKLGSVALMSGGEQALTAISLIFAIFLRKPSPFCLLDEVDAPLDEANVGRFNEMVREMSSISQFIVITHNKRTMEIADHLYGVTMEEPGVSKIVAVRMNHQQNEKSVP